MTVPSADLTTTHLDASTDDPAQARSELKAAVDKINAIINDLGAGNTVWTNANDGAGSGLDSDLLDGQSSAYYRDAGNINAGTLALARLHSLFHQRTLPHVRGCVSKFPHQKSSFRRS